MATYLSSNMYIQQLPKILLALIILTASFSARAQDPTPQEKFALKSLIPTSPEASMLGRFGDIPIGYYTGTAEISIPIYKIKVNGLEVPVSLNYHSSGIRVEDEASDVGLGWLMEPGGAIIQIVNGKEDRLDHIIYNSMYPGTLTSDYSFLNAHIAIQGVHGGRNAIGQPWPCGTYVPNSDTQQELLNLLAGEGQPDTYQFSFPGGYNGKFYIDPSTDQPVMIDKKAEIKFERIGLNWKATTLDGNKFFFQTMESVILNGNDYLGYTWKLTQIVLNNGKTINFSYTSGQFDWQSVSESFHTQFPINQPTGVGIDPPIAGSLDFYTTPRRSGTHHNIFTLSQITTPDETINFNLEDRADMAIKRVRSVDITSAVTGRLIKTFALNYDYFSYSMTGGTYQDYQYNPYTTAAPPADYVAKRLKLLSVKEIGYDNNGQPTENPPYQFTYDETNSLPLKTSFSRDFWGYFNGANNAKLTPDISYFYSAGMLSYGTPYWILDWVKGANRTPDKTMMTAGVLTKLKYPTGGSTEFTYEPNTFTNFNSPDADKVFAFKKFINITDENSPVYQTTATFTLPREMTLSFTHLFAKGVPGNSVTFDDMENATVTLNKISGGTTTQLKQWRFTTSQRTEFDTNGMITIKDTYNFPYEAGAQYQLVDDLPDYLGDQHDVSKSANVTSQCNYYDVPTVQTQPSYGGGLRIASIKNYDNNGTLVSNKAIKYVNQDGTSSGLLMAPLQFLSSRMMYFNYLYHEDPQYYFWAPVDETGYVPFKTIGTGEVWWLSSESEVPLASSAGGNTVGYSRVEEIELANGSATNGKHVFYYHNGVSEWGANTPDNPDLFNGSLVKEEVFDNPGTKLQQVDYVYSNKLNHTLNGFKAICDNLTNYECRALDPYAQTHFNDEYIILNYPINSNWWVLDNKTTTQYYNGSGVVSTQTFTYNDIGQVNALLAVNSDQKTLKHQFLFPYDASSPPGTIEDDLRSRSLYNYLLEDHTLVNNVEVSQAKISYANVSGQFVKTKIEKSYNGGTLVPDVSFDVYGDNQTPLEIRERNAKVSSLIWDDTHSNVIAQAVNAHVQDMAYSSFEPGQTGNWTVSSPSRNSYGFTGVQSYNLSNGDISKTGLNPYGTYILSYWAKSTIPLIIAGTVSGYPHIGPSLNGWTYFTHSITGVSSIDITGSMTIDEIRLYPFDAQLTTYTFAPLIGMTSMTDLKNLTTYYEYDSFNRLRIVKDKDGNIVKAYCYNYKGQSTNCMTPELSNQPQIIYARLEVDNITYGSSGSWNDMTYTSNGDVYIRFYSDVNCTVQYTLTSAMVVSVQDLFESNDDVYGYYSVPYDNTYTVPIGYSSYSIGNQSLYNDHEYYDFTWDQWHYTYMSWSYSAMASTNGDYIPE